MVQYNSIEDLIKRFKKFLEIDLQQRQKTVQNHIAVVYRLMDYCDPLNANKEDLRDYLAQFKNSPKTYAWHLCELKRFYRDFLRRPDLVESFRFPRIIPRLKLIPSKKELKEFSQYLNKEDLALFLVFASSGLRRSEVLTLKLGDVDFEKRMFIPSRSSLTKFSWVGFFNEEAKSALEQFIQSREDRRRSLFPYARSKLGCIWKDARRKTGIDITPQVLREWFSEEMSNLGVPERYIDAFCGRVPRSVLARHYTDYRPDKLKMIYDRADLKVLS
ncbi:MAG: site-specific integrase [Nitrososphaerota archaeon]